MVACRFVKPAHLLERPADRKLQRGVALIELCRFFVLVKGVFEVSAQVMQLPHRVIDHGRQGIQCQRTSVVLECFVETAGFAQQPGRVHQRLYAGRIEFERTFQ